jgi:hypothetical protein
MSGGLLTVIVLGSGVLVGLLLGRRWLLLVAFGIVVAVLAAGLDFEGKPDLFAPLAGALFIAFELFGVGLRTWCCLSGRDAGSRLVRSDQGGRGWPRHPPLRQSADADDVGPLQVVREIKSDCSFYVLHSQVRRSPGQRIVVDVESHLQSSRDAAVGRFGELVGKKDPVARPGGLNAWARGKPDRPTLRADPALFSHTAAARRDFALHRTRRRDDDCTALRSHGLRGTTGLTITRGRGPAFAGGRTAFPRRFHARSAVAPGAGLGSSLGSWWVVFIAASRGEQGSCAQRNAHHPAK